MSARKNDGMIRTLVYLRNHNLKNGVERFRLREFRALLMREFGSDIYRQINPRMDFLEVEGVIKVETTQSSQFVMLELDRLEKLIEELSQGR